MLEFDADGNVNLLRYGSTWVGPGGSMDIADAVEDVVFCGTLRAGGLQVTGQDGRLEINAEGNTPRAVSDIQGVCFNGERMRSQGKTVHYITERAVFRLTDDGVELCEVAPGIDIDRDVLGRMSFVPKLASDVADDGRAHLPTWAHGPAPRLGPRTKPPQPSRLKCDAPVLSPHEAVTQWSSADQRPPALLRSAW